MTNDAEITDDNAERVLLALIAQCQDIIRDVAIPAANAAPDDLERRRYLTSVVELVKVGAAVGDTLARLRGGLTQETRQRIVVERIEKSAALLDIPKPVQAAARRGHPAVDKRGEGVV